MEDEAQVDQDNEQDETNVRLYYCLIPQNPCVNYSFSRFDSRKAIFGGMKVETITIKKNAHYILYLIYKKKKIFFFFKFSVFDFNYSDRQGL